MERRLLSRLFLLLVVAAYAVIGVLYAVFTPTWQIPDEPAHYNYVRALGEGRGLPVIGPGDYDQAYLSRLTTKDFPSELPIDTLGYEDHQPPLYYLLAVPIYVLFGGVVLPLRLLSVVFGAGLLLTAFGTVRAIFPRRPQLALTTAALIAFIPQHVAMTAGVNNDTLAELVVGGTLWALMVYVGERHERPWPVGLLLGTALLTKTTAYVTLGVAVLAVVMRWRREHRTRRWAVGQLAWMLVPVLLVSAPWLVRNGLTYGWLDPLGLAQHNEVVEGQPRSSEWLALYGWGGLLSRMARTTFQSFWGQFGWMKVVLPAGVYRALALFSVLLAACFLWWLFNRRRAGLRPRQRASLLLLLASSLLTILSFLWYNITFVQHQGRYLFPALIPMATAAALGLDTLAGLLPRRLRPWTAAGVFSAFAALDVCCLFKFIVPFLAR